MDLVARHAAARSRLAAAVLLTAACAGAGGTREAGAPAAQGPAVAAQGKPAAGEFTPSKPPATHYGASAGACGRSSAIDIVMDELAAAAKRSGRAAPTLDPAVCAVAETFLGWDRVAPAPPRPQVLAFTSRWFGLPAPVAPPTVATLDTSDEKMVAEQIVQGVGSSVLNAIHPRLGIALQRTRKGKDVKYKASVVLLDAPLQLEPLPRRLELGQRATLSGKLVGGVTNPKVQISDATGSLTNPEQPQGDAFRAELSCGDRPGTIQVEIRGEYEGREGAVASFPVACGEPLARAIAVAPEPWPADAAQAERRILELVNEERQQAGLRPLTWDDGVATVARGISEEISSRGGAQGIDVGARLRKEGIASPVILQSAAADRTFERVHERLVSSPSNRANIMSAEVTNAGIGAVSGADAQGNPVVYVTEVFIRELPPLDVAKVRDDLRSAVAQKRKDARTTALANDPTLDAVAQRYAEALAAAGGPLPKEQHAELTAPLNKAFTAVTMIQGAKQEPLDFAEEPQATAPGKSLGVGVAQGKHQVLGRNATYVILMVGTPRAGAEKPAAAPKTRKPRS